MSVETKKYKTRNIPSEFMNDDDVLQVIVCTIDRIETSLHNQHSIDDLYKEDCNIYYIYIYIQRWIVSL